MIKFNAIADLLFNERHWFSALEISAIEGSVHVFQRKPSLTSDYSHEEMEIGFSLRMRVRIRQRTSTHRTILRGLHDESSNKHHSDPGTLHVRSNDT